MVAPLKFFPALTLGLLLLTGAGSTALWAAQAVLPTESANRVALVIGNSRYKSGQALTNPVNDATDIARKLRELGFTKVVLGVDMDKRAMRKSLREFRDALRPGDVALAYYAGHGVMVGGINYMVPIDAKLEEEDDVKDDAIPMDDLLKMMEESRTRTNILMLDACRDNPFKLHSRVRATKALGLASMQDIAGEGTQIIYAARPGKTASDGAGRNGVFTSALLEHIDTPGLTLNDLVGRLADDVRRTTNNKQQPCAEGVLTGTFTFKLRLSVADKPVADKPAIPNPQLEEAEFWGEAKAAGNAEGYQAYIEQYPSGRYVGLARAHIKRMGESAGSGGIAGKGDPASPAFKAAEAAPRPASPPEPPRPVAKETPAGLAPPTEPKADEQRILAQREAERSAAEKRATEKLAVEQERAAENKKAAEAARATEEQNQKIQRVAIDPKKETTDRERPPTEPKSDEQQALTQREAERGSAEKRAAASLAGERERALAQTCNIPSLICNMAKLAFEQERAAAVATATEVQNQRIQLASIKPALSGPAGAAIDPKFVAVIDALRRMSSGGGLTFAAVTGVLITGNSADLKEPLKKYGDGVHALGDHSAVAWAIEPDGKITAGRASDLSRQEMADDRARLECQKKQSPHVAQAQCQVFYRSKAIDPLALSKLVEAAQGADYASWQQGFIQSFERLAK